MIKISGKAFLVFLVSWLLCNGVSVAAQKASRPVVVDLNRCGFQTDNFVSFSTLMNNRTYDMSDEYEANKVHISDATVHSPESELAFDEDLDREVERIRTLLRERLGQESKTFHTEWGYRNTTWLNGLSLDVSGGGNEKALMFGFNTEFMVFEPSLNRSTTLSRAKNIFGTRIKKIEERSSSYKVATLECGGYLLSMDFAHFDHRQTDLQLKSIQLELSQPVSQPREVETWADTTIDKWTVENAYLYPERVAAPAECEINSDAIAELNNKYPIYPDCPNSKNIISSVDLNDDQTCEYYLTQNWGRRCEAYTSILDNSGNQIGTFAGTPKNIYYAEKKNNFYRLLVPTWGGHRTNIIFVTNVLVHGGNGYGCEYCLDSSHGAFMDLAKAAYDKQDYELASIFYWNAYRMNGETKLSDANNIALALIKQNKFGPAIDVLSKHLNQTNDEISLSESQPCYSANCKPSLQKLARLKSSAHYNRAIAYEKLGDNDNALSDYIKADQLRASKSAKEAINRLSNP